MATAANLDVQKAINKTFPKGSNERNALTKFVEEGININQDREAARWVTKAWSKVLTTIKQTWGI